MTTLLQRLCLPGMLLVFVGVVRNASGDELLHQYRNDSLHYAFDLPADWVEIPQNVIQDHSKWAAGKLGDVPANYVVGFQRPSANYFSRPYVLVSHIPAGPAELAAVKKIFVYLNMFYCSFFILGII